MSYNINLNEIIIYLKELMACSIEASCYYTVPKLFEAQFFELKTLSGQRRKLKHAKFFRGQLLK